MRLFIRFLVVICLPCLANLAAGGSLKITLNPDQASAAGALWRVDGGAWMKSESVVNNLSAGPHPVDFATVTGWVAPAPFSVSVTDDDTTTVSRVYLQSASLTVTLSPPSAQWKVDETPWVTSGTAVTNLAPGNHTIRYRRVPGYQIPETEIVNLAAGQAVAWARSYVQGAQLKLILMPSYAQWRIDGGIWRDGGATVTDLTPGYHSVEYSSVSGFKGPQNETFNLMPGETLSPQRNYVQLAQITVTLNQTNSWWRVDGGAWQASGATVSNLTPGVHAVSFSQVNGYYLLPDEVISLSEGQIATVSRSYFRRRP
jgi:hypothetical protein